MKRSRKHMWGFIACCLLLAIATACGAKEQTSSSQSAEVKKTKLVKHHMGETEVPVDPKRIVSIQYTGELLALGVKPIGVRNFDLENPYMKPKLQGTESIGDQANLEKILSLAPDLIIATDTDAKIYEDLKKIAPTVLIPWITMDVEEHLQQIAEIVGKTKEAEAWKTSFQSRSKELRKSLTQVKEQETVLIFRIYPDSFSVYGDRNMGHVFYRGLGLTPPKLIQDEIQKKPGAFNQQKISLEVLPQYSADHMIVMVESLKEAEKQLAEITNMAIWKGLPAVKNNKVYFIERKQWLSYDPVSIQGQLEDSVKLFQR